MSCVPSKDLNFDVTLNDSQYLISETEPLDLELYKTKVKRTKNGTNLSKSQQNKEQLVISTLTTSLQSWGLPETILEKYRERGIVNMFNWQVECLANKNVLLKRHNLVYSAPTSAGKTLVAEILALKTLLEKNKKVLIILPFVSVVREKMFYFQDILSSSGIRVEGFMGSHSPPGGFKAVQLAICTIEKANSIINKLLEEKSLSDVGAVVVDEMHLLGDSSRGYLLELLLTKLRYMSLKSEDINMQLIGMSATLSNLDLLSKWLNAELYTTTFRPIPLQEYCLLSNNIFDTQFKLYRNLQTLPDLVEDSDNILQLCLETIKSSCSVLIFCPTKNWCENLAQQISVAFRKLGMSKSSFGTCLREQLNSNAIMEILEQLKRCPVGLDSVLKKTVSFGVAFHHAGLTMDERDIIEGAFRNCVLRVLIATSTLSSGVNLPAQRVIIRTPRFCGKPIDSLTYRQMIGRAGRMGKDTSGESILICQNTDKRVAEELLSAKLHPIESCLEGAGKLKRAILEVIASGVATTPEDITLFTNCTLLAAGLEENMGIDNPIEQSVEFLIQNEFIRLQKEENGDMKYIATSLAKACLSSSLPPEDGLALLEEIEKARQCFVLDSDLHLLYLVTPYSVCNQWSNLDWMLYLEFWEKLTPSMKRVAELVGVQEGFIFNATRGRINTSTSKQFHRLQIHRRFYTALALQDLVNEVPLNNVASKYQCNRGMLQSLQQSAAMFAGMVTKFCSQLGWKNIEILVSQFQDRLQFGIQHELLDLMKLSNLNGQRARALFNSGVENLSDLASLDISKLENILLSSVPFQSEKERDGESDYDVEQKRKVRGIWITGRQGLTAREAAEMLIKDARKYLQLEIGAAVLKWDSNTQSSAAKEHVQFEEKNIPNTSKQNISAKFREALANKMETPSIQPAIAKEHSDINSESKTSKFEQNNIPSTSKQNVSASFCPAVVENPLPSIGCISIKPDTECVSETENFITEERNTNYKSEVTKTAEIDSENDCIIPSTQNNESSYSFRGLNFSIEERESSVNNSNHKKEIVNSKTSEIKSSLFITETDSKNLTVAHENTSETSYSLQSINFTLEEAFSSDNNSIIVSLLDIKKSSPKDVQRSNSKSDSSLESIQFFLEDDVLSNDSMDMKNVSVEKNNILNNKTENEFNENWTTFEIPSFSLNTTSETKRSPLNELKINRLPLSPNQSDSESSLFGESMYLNSKLCNALDETSVKEDFKMEDTSFFNNISKAFETKNLITNNEATDQDLNDVVETSQTEITDCSMASICSIRKRKHPKSRKRTSIDLCNDLFSDQKVPEDSPCKKLKLVTNNIKVTLKPEIDPSAVDLANVDIIDVCGDKILFETFCNEAHSKTKISLAVACDRIKIDVPVIGQHIVAQSSVTTANDNSKYTDEERLVSGVVLSWGENFVYFLNFCNEEHVTNVEKIELLQNILNKHDLVLRIFEYKEQAKLLYNSCKVSINSTHVEDPKIADWILEPEGKEKNLPSMVTNLHD